MPSTGCQQFSRVGLHHDDARAELRLGRVDWRGSTGPGQKNWPYGISDSPLNSFQKTIDEVPLRSKPRGTRRGAIRYGRMAVEFLDPLGRGEKPSNIPGGICWLDLLVLVERADRYSVAVLTPDCRA